jgi:hypothetical protein
MKNDNITKRKIKDSNISFITILLILNSVKQSL